MHQLPTDVTDFTLTETGFVYLHPQTGIPHWVADFDGQAWRFWWHSDKYWVTQRALSTKEVQTLYHVEKRLCESSAESYHILNDINRPKY